MEKYRLALEAIAHMGHDGMTDREARGLLALAVATARLELAMNAAGLLSDRD
ncbi:MAG: hypothetical protein M0R75_13610 [Dehalococcoidia bacterium]|nr:hypothetical protein [Dehalococcoidia bacterium]